MSNPSTPPQAVRGIVYKCVMPHECFCICRKVGRKCARLCESRSLLVRCLAKWKREAKQLTFGTLLGLTPRRERSMADRIKGVTAEGTTAAKTRLFTEVLPRSMQTSRPSDSSPVTDWEGSVMEDRKAKF